MNAVTFRTVVWLAAILSAAAPAAADTIPLCGPLCLHSTESARVNLTMTHELQRDRQVHLSLPRSAIIYVSGYDSEEAGLPDRVETSGPWLQFALVAPDGTPIGEAAALYAQENGVSLDRAATMLRPDYAVVQVSVVGRNIANERLFSAWLPAHEEDATIKTAESFDGLPAQITWYRPRAGAIGKAAIDGPYITYFPLNDQDPFVLIRCEAKPDEIHWCTYQMRPNDLVKLEVHMSDFRVYGGRKFVRDRLGMILRAYCAFDINCTQ